LLEHAQLLTDFQLELQGLTERIEEDLQKSEKIDSLALKIEYLRAMAQEKLKVNLNKETNSLKKFSL